MFGELNMQVVVLTLLYSWAGLGIAIVNDFKSVSHSSYIKHNNIEVLQHSSCCLHSESTDCTATLVH
jgi:hypothetical protein